MVIRVLDKATVNQIAAGEVVERPASVVKELVENALDAGATQIGVERRGGGIQLIKVSDNGGGIAAGEVALAFERHATSKIKSAQDLSSIGSLGFRGEALPSIAAVADVELVTCGVGEKSGSYIALEGGTIIKQSGQARTQGTTITVRNLFKRVPARLKFLKSIPTETGHAANAVSQYALAYPETAFSFTVDGKESLRTSGKGRLLDAVIDVYGAAVAAKMMSVSAEESVWRSGDGAGQDTLIKVTGLAGAPEAGRSSRDFLSFYVNRRWVSSRILTRAVEEAYHGLLMTGKHPVAVLEISINPGEVDVNIHPAKTEVKFRNDGDIFRAVQKAVRGALTAQMAVPRIEDTAAPYKATSLPRAPEQLWGRPRVEPPPEATAPLLANALPMLRVVGQVMERYIVAEGPDGMYIIDQHAAHERIRYDQLLRQRESKKPEIQGLLESAAFEVTPRQDAVMRSCLESLKEFGFGVESFGERTYLVRSVPALAADDWPAMLRELLDTLAGEEKSRWQERMVASIACHGAIKSGQTLSDDEMRALVRQLEQTANPHTCPHGRPTVMRLSAAQLEREFGRG
jgi:DNA mismatch repair protein MutL